MTSPDEPPQRPLSRRAAARVARLEQALRANLQRRKQQARAREAPEPAGGDLPSQDPHRASPAVVVAVAGATDATITRRTDHSVGGAASDPPSDRSGGTLSSDSRGGRTEG